MLAVVSAHLVPKCFAKEGASLVLAARRRDKLEAVAAELKQAYQSKIYLLEMDVSAIAIQLETSLASLPESWRQVDILVNNAGLSRGIDKLQRGGYSELGKR